MRPRFDLRRFEPRFGGTLASAEFRDAGGFFDQVAAVGGFCGKDLADAALFDDRVVCTGQAGAGKKILDIAQTAGFAVELIFALAREVKPTCNGNSLARGKIECKRTRPPVTFCLDLRLDDLRGTDLGGLDRLDLRLLRLDIRCLLRSLSIGDRIDSSGSSIVSASISSMSTACSSMPLKVSSMSSSSFSSMSNNSVVANQVQNDLGHAAGLAVLGALKDDVLHLAAAKRFGTLLAEHPRDGVGHIRLAAAVRADDGGDAAAGKNDLGVVGKRLKARNF